MASIRSLQTQAKEPRHGVETLVPSRLPPRRPAGKPPPGRGRVRRPPGPGARWPRARRLPGPGPLLQPHLPDRQPDRSGRPGAAPAVGRADRGVGGLQPEHPVRRRQDPRAHAALSPGQARAGRARVAGGGAAAAPGRAGAHPAGGHRGLRRHRVRLAARPRGRRWHAAAPDAVGRDRLPARRRGGAGGAGRARGAVHRAEGGRDPGVPAQGSAGASS